MIWGVKKGGTWRTVRVPDQRHGGQGHSWHHEWCFFTLRKIPWKSCVDILISSVSGRGSQEGGYLEALRVPDRRHGGHGYSWCHELCFFTLSKIPWKFCVDIFTGSVSGIGGQEGGTWRTLKVPDRRLGGQGHPWCHGWPCLTPRIISWKFRVVIFMFCEVINDLGVNGQPH